MRWICPFMFFVIAIMETGQVHTEFEFIERKVNVQDVNSGIDDSEETVNIIKQSRGRHFTVWSKWSGCHGGHKKRRRHCVRRHICGDSLRIEVAGCGYTSRTLPRKIESRDEINESNMRVQVTQRRHLKQYDGAYKFRGFSQWGPWNPCSRRCSTTRRRYCEKQGICGHKVMRQSAYCYVEGSYCHRWIRGRMQRRKDPGYNYKVVEELSQPLRAIHREDSRRSPVPPECGVLGRYRGSPSGRLRSRLRGMIRIIGGRPAPPGKWSWQVAVLNRYKEAFCGGTLISLRWVVTAAHCVRKRLYVRLGEHDLMVRTQGEVEMRVTEAVIHPQYDPDTVVNDVAMLRLPAPARPELGHGIACLPQPYHHLPPHTTCIILGWGKKRPTDVHGTRILQEAQVSTIQQGVCRRSYWQYSITNDMVCAGRGRRDSCAGDSGGPLLCRDKDMKYYLQGITSFGDGCGKRGKYGIYTRTAGYVSWMQHIINHKYLDE